MKVLSLAAASCFAIAVATAGTAARADAKAYSHVVIFGDSLSDQGNTEFAFGLPPLSIYGLGRYSDADNWVDILSQQLNVKITNSLAHGTNYAYGFGTTGSQNSPPPVPFSPQTLAQQEQTYLNHVHRHADPSALYVIEGGGTDILGLLFAAQTNPLLLLFVPSLDLTGAQNVANETQALLRAGAQHVMVANVPNLGLLPIVTEQSGLGGLIAPSVATNAAQLWDFDLANDVLPLTRGGKVTLWDFYNTSALALASAQSFGITNTTTECVKGYGTTLGVTNQCTPSIERTHAFYDQVHFTALGYFGMEQGAMCALGNPTVLGWPQSACVVSQNSMRSQRSGRYVPASAFSAAHAAGDHRTGAT
jgi:outer membrane lipase/esterase